MTHTYSNCNFSPANAFAEHMKSPGVVFIMILTQRPAAKLPLGRKSDTWDTVTSCRFGPWALRRHVGGEGEACASNI